MQYENLQPGRTTRDANTTRFGTANAFPARTSLPLHNDAVVVAAYSNTFAWKHRGKQKIQHHPDVPTKTVPKHEAKMHTTSQMALL